MYVWILTREINQYDQDGEYLVAVFGQKPTHQELTALGVPQNRLRHVLNGGGRVDWENTWFNLRSYEIESEEESNGGKRLTVRVENAK